MPDPNTVVERDEQRFPNRGRFTQADMDAFIASPVCKQCICSGYTLAELIKIAQENDWTWEQTMAATGAGAECEVCVPYIKRAIENNEPEIVINPRDTGMFIHKDGILEKEPPQLAKSNMNPDAISDPIKEARITAMAVDDKKDEVDIKKEIE